MTFELVKEYRDGGIIEEVYEAVGVGSAPNDEIYNAFFASEHTTMFSKASILRDAGKVYVIHEYGRG